MNRFAFKLQKFFADMIKDEEVKTEFKLNDFDVITGLFEVMEQSDENLYHLLLETIFLFARVLLDLLLDTNSLNIDQSRPY